MTGLSPRDVVRILRADPGACAGAFRVCAGTLRQRGAPRRAPGVGSACI